MRWIKAIDRPPVSEWKGPVRFDHKDGQWTYGIRTGMQMDYASGVYEDIEYLDDSPPASAVEEAARMYPYHSFLRHDTTDKLRQAHITCAGMYTDTIDKLKAENSKMRQALEWYADAGNYLGDNGQVATAYTNDRIANKATEALKTP